MSEDKTPRKYGKGDKPPTQYLGQLDGFYLLKRLGGGGMGDVYLAQSEHNPEMLRALKIIKTQSDAELDEIVDRWRVECKVSERVRALKHKHIVQVYDGKAIKGYNANTNKEELIFYLSMEYVDGRTLASMLERTPPSLDSGMKIGIDIASALEAAHEIGILHRDVKPSNIIVDDRLEGKTQAYLLDFGISKVLSEPSGLTEMHGEAAVGTLNYMPPEELLKLMGQDYLPEQDERGDIWAFGKVLHEMFNRISKPYEQPTQVSSKRGLEQAAQEALRWVPKKIVGLPDPVYDLIVDMTRRRPELRPEARDVRARLGSELYSRDTLAGTQPITIGPQEVRLEQLLNDIRNEHMSEEEFARKQGLFIMVPTDGYFKATHPNLRMDASYARDVTYFKVFAPQSKHEWVFGRGEGVDCRYAERTMSRKHFKITRLQIDGEDRFVITDLGSNNGTSLNGLKLPPNKREVIQNESRILAGNLDLTFATPRYARKNVDTIRFKVLKDDKTPKQKRQDLENQAGA